MPLCQTWRAAKDAARSEDGGITALSLFLFMGTALAAGLALDVHNALQSRNQLQGAADAAGHAALFWRYRNDEADAIAKGIEVAEANMPVSRYGDVLATADVEFGDWDPVARVFTPAAGNPTAVRVTARRDEGRGNGVGTFLLRMIGTPELNLSAVSVWDAEESWCPGGKGFFALKEIQLLTAPTIDGGVCLHSEDRVTLLQDPTFNPGSTLSMPDARHLGFPREVIDPTSGLAAALEGGSTNLDAFYNDLPGIAVDHLDPGLDIQPDYVTDLSLPLPVTPTNSEVTPGDIVANAVNHLKCQGPTLTFDEGMVVEDAVVVTDCQVYFEPGVALENATLVVLDPSSQAIQAPDGVRLGAEDYCKTGQGGATVVSLGDVSLGAGSSAFGAAVIADGSITVDAVPDGLGGVNFMAGGGIEASASGTVGNCPFGPPKPFPIPVFKMVL